MRRKHSLFAQTLYVYFEIAVTIAMCLGSTLYLVSHENKQIGMLREQNRSLMEIPLLIDSAQRSARTYFYSRDSQDMEDFLHDAQSVDAATDIMYDYSVLDTDVRLYARLVKWMMENQQTYTAGLMDTAEPQSDDYREWVDMQAQYDTISSLSMQLMLQHSAYVEDESERIHLQSSSLIVTFVLCSILLVCLAILLGLRAVKRGFGSLKSVSETAQRLSARQWDVDDIQPSGYVEIDHVAATINQMKNEIKRYVSEMEEKARIESDLNTVLLQNEKQERMLKEVRLLALQMQINPHFLFNTFNLITRLIEFEQRDIAIDVVHAISRILRYNLDSRSNLVAMKDEINSLQDYILIQRIRFMDAVSFSCTINCSVENAVMPAFVLQPILENAIKHGMRDTTHNGEIAITLSHGTDGFHFIVSDNGPGMDVSRLEQIKPQGIGVRNIQERLELHYQRRDLLWFESNGLGAGTRAHILIPDDHEEKEAISNDSTVDC